METAGVTHRRNVFTDENDEWNVTDDDFIGDIDTSVTSSGGARQRVTTTNNINSTGSEPSTSKIANNNKSNNVDNLVNKDEDEYDADSKETRLSLLEELLLLGLKDKEGHISFWNDSLSSGLRGAILIELALRNKIGLESVGMRKRNVGDLRIIAKKDGLVGDVLLDEAFNHIKGNNQQFTTKQWIDYLSGETWNPMRLKLQLKNVRERIAKNLTEMGVCTTEMQNFVVFNMATHPLIDSAIKERIMRKVQEALLTRWCPDFDKFPKRVLSLIMLAQASDVLENALANLSDSDYNVAMGRVKELNNMDFNSFTTSSESSNDSGVNAVMLATFLSYEL